jgi:hypothetical protein
VKKVVTIVMKLYCMKKVDRDGRFNASSCTSSLGCSNILVTSCKQGNLVSMTRRVLSQKHDLAMHGVPLTVAILPESRLTKKLLER